ncbi:sensor domain-containing diguanylate cyclase [Patulibacter sp.]|uniref:GGDEF domain-containing protein n=1 Tax=Patulibacter sp. TaxID=1912859 RepID=UPI0027284BF7|nr:sensor domain-containing diguanylate cyclase [Patulibacter sp.]MDO9407351.1 PAS domain-containing protein [Patulibacter sp.]
MKTGPSETTRLPTLLAAVVGALDAVDDHVAVLDTDGRILHVNVAWQRFALDNGAEDLNWIGTNYVAASTPSGDDPLEDPINKGIRSVLDGTRATFTLEYDCHAPDELRWFRLRVRSLEVPGVGAVVTHTDVTTRRMHERTLERLSTKDELTGLANRASLQQGVAHMLEESRAVGVVVVSMEDVSDPGMTLPDPVVARAAALLSELFPSPAITARYGQHQLVVAIAGLGADQLAEANEIVDITMETGMNAVANLRTTVAAQIVTGEAADASVLDDLVAQGRSDAAPEQG